MTKLMEAMNYLETLLEVEKIKKYTFDSETGDFTIFISALEKTSNFSGHTYESEPLEEAIFFEDIADTEGRVVLDVIEAWEKSFDEWVYKVSGESKYDNDMWNYWRKKGA